MFYLPYGEASKVHRHSSVMVLTPLLVGMLEVQILPLLQELFACSIGRGRAMGSGRGTDDRRRQQGVRWSTIAVAVGVSLAGLIYQPRCLNMRIDALRLVSLSIIRYSMLILSLRASNRSYRIDSDIVDDIHGLADDPSGNSDSDSNNIDDDDDDDQSNSSVTTTVGASSSSPRWTYPIISFYGHIACIMCHLLRKVL